MAKGKGTIKGWITKNGVHIPIYGEYTVEKTEPKPKRSSFQRKHTYNINEDMDVERLDRIDSPQDYSANPYAEFLATSYPHGYNFGELYQYYHNTGDTAFAAIADYNKTIHLDAIGSTGKGAGTELLSRIMSHAVSKDKGLDWGADNTDSMSYYSHLGLDKYSHEILKGHPNAGKQYYIPKEDLPGVLRELRNRKKKGAK